MKKIMSILFSSILMWICATGLWACTDMETPAVSPRKAFIKSFKVDDVNGVIHVADKVIQLYFPDDIDLTAIIPTIIVSDGATYSPMGAIDLSSPVTYTVTCDNQSTTQYVVEAMENVGNRVEADVNRVFFSPCGVLRNHFVPDYPGDEFNSNKYYDYTHNWKNTTDTLVWGIDVKNAGKLKVTPKLGVPDSQNGAVIELIIENQKQEIVLTSTGGYTLFKEQAAVIFSLPKAGRYAVKMKIKSTIDATKDVAYAQSLVFGGGAALELAPVVLRWRPAAVHCGWENASKPTNVELAIHEVTVISDFIDSYSPITAPFGYFGSTWVTKDEQFGGINFSLWSFGAGSEPPPTEKFSHLIAVGKGGYIDGFNHEGTGVKRRGDNPYVAMTGERTQVLAIKKIPGNPYDVFHSYYWDSNTKEWILFGCGKKYNEKALIYLSTGAFVEQPGPPDVQRSNHIKREIHFRGWYMDKDRKLYPINLMRPGGDLENSTYKNWREKEGKFVLEMGGFDPLLTEKPTEVRLSSSSAEVPEYLSEKNLATLGELPIKITEETATDVEATSAVLNFKVDKFGTAPVVKVYWGVKDGLTFVKGNVGSGGVVNWGYHTTISPSATSFSYKIEGLTPKTKYFYRLQITNQEGETWSYDTLNFTTTDGEAVTPITKLSFKAIDGHDSQDGDVTSFQPLMNTVDGQFLVEKSSFYPWENMADLVENDTQVTSMRFSLDGKEVEKLDPDSKARGNFIVLGIQREAVIAGNVFNKVKLSWDANKKNSAFQSAYVANGGFLQFDLIFDLKDKQGNKMIEIEDVAPNKEGNQPKYAATTIRLKCLNRNANAKLVQMVENTPSFQKPTTDVGLDLMTDYDVSTVWKKEFGADTPTLDWIIRYWTTDGLFRRNVVGAELTYKYCAASWGAATVVEGKIKLHISKDITPGEYCFRLVAKEKANPQKYIVFNYPFIVT